uniref:Delta-like protein n=1 Tax=Ciona savignyi TaxID=51511 RepID=Q95YG0_CIOSA|nr:Delta [Ciona savignyi]
MFLMKIRFALLVLSHYFVSVTSEGSFQLRLTQLVNDGGVTESGLCCSGPSFPNCIEQCRTSIRVCLKHFQATVDPSGPCTFGSYKSPVIGGNSFAPENTSYIRRHPTVFDFTFRWPGSFSMIVDVLHEVNTETPILISRLIVSNSHVTTQPRTDPTWITPAPFMKHGVELHYSYRIVCKEYLYGGDCAKHCHPRDDIFGHFSCDEQGNKVCHPGWTNDDNGAYCTSPVCSKGCDTERGSCRRPNECVCKVGWKGKLCNECATMPGCVHGTCDQRFQCNCNPGWGGSYCNQDLNYCTNHHPCFNGGICSNTGHGSFTCTCVPGYIGRRCQFKISACSPNPCHNDGECIEKADGYECNCKNNFYGSLCERTHVTCYDSPCNNGGLCVPQKDKYICRCTQQWKGYNCEERVDPCSPNLCLNGGICSVRNNIPKCECRVGFAGRFCNVNTQCVNNPCLNGGSCLTRSQGFQCTCPPGYKGRLCGKLDNCFSSSCLRDGSCPMLENRRSCICKFLLAATSCEAIERKCDIHICNLGDCENGSNGCGCLQNFTCISEPPVPPTNIKSITNLPSSIHSKLVVVSKTSASPQLSTTHWIVITFCVGSLLLLLVLILACVMYARNSRKAVKSSSETSESPMESVQTWDAGQSAADVSKPSVVKAEVSIDAEATKLLDPEPIQTRVALPCAKCPCSHTVVTVEMAKVENHQVDKGPCPTYEEACETSPCLT